MILTGYKYGDQKVYVVPFHVTIPEINLTRIMTFVVDTGTTTTTICGPDANSLNLNLSSFSDRISQTYVDHQGNISPLISFHDCTLDYSNGDVQYSVTLDIDVEIQLKDPENKRTFMNSLSLLGMDFLESFNLSFRNDCVYLEKEDN